LEAVSAGQAGPESPVGIGLVLDVNAMVPLVLLKIFSVEDAGPGNCDVNK